MKMRMNVVRVALITALVALSAHAADKQSEALPKGKIYSYKTVDGVAREIEVFFPSEKHERPVPGIILFHGGGWGGGTRKQFSYQCDYFGRRGIVAATVTYRLVTKADRAAMPDGQSPKRVCITDAKSAIRWFKQQSDELGIDPVRIVAGGGSAGGHISLLATTTPGLNDPVDPDGIDTSVAAYVLFNPALSLSDAKDPEIDFLQQISPNFPPAIVFFGSKDEKWLKGWNLAYQKLKSLGSDSVDFRMAEGEKHAFFNRAPWKDVTLVEADRFLTKLGFLKGKPTLEVSVSEARLDRVP